MEKIVSYLSYSERLGKLFSAPSSLLLQADPAVQKAIIRRAEERVYGSKGLKFFENNEPSRLKRLSRRSLAQFMCQNALIGVWWIKTLRKLGFGLVLPILFFILCFKSLFSRKMFAKSSEAPDLVVFYWADRLDKFVRPGEFENKKVILHQTQNVWLGPVEIRFFLNAVWSCFRMVLYPELLCNFIRWLAYYGYVRRLYSPKVIANFFEGTASSSLMTAYSGENGMKHIDLQHGELFYTADSAFCEFDEFRLWGQYFKEIFAWHQSPEEKIKVTGTVYHRDLFFKFRKNLQPRPRRLLIIDPFMQQAEGFYTSLLGVLKCLDKSWEIRVRRHPADRRVSLPYIQKTNSELLLKNNEQYLEEEHPKMVPIEEALGKSRVVVGVASAAMLEAWVLGCKLIHLKGGPSRSMLMERYQGSKNVIYNDKNSDEQLRTFLSEPAYLNADEDKLINYITALEKNQT